MAASLSEIEGQRDFVLNELKKLGFKLNEKKSQLSPSTRKKFIGFVVETDASAEHVKISIPKERTNTVKKDIRRALRQGVVAARFLARMAGQLVSMTKAIIPTKLLLRNVYRLLSLKKDWQATLNVSLDVKNDLVAGSFRPLERKSLKSLSSRMGDSGNRCIPRGLGKQTYGWRLTPEVCTGFLEFRNETKALERERNYCRTPQFKDFCERSVRQISFDSIRQREHGGLHQYAGRSESKPHKCSYQHSDTGKSKAFEGEQELRCRSAIPLFEQIRMDDTSTCIPISRHHMGSTHM